MKGNKEKTVLVSCAVVYKRDKKDAKLTWLIVRQTENSDWELPKTTTRRGESSVRASLRMTGEQAMMRAKILEEVGRASGSTVVNGKDVPQKFLFYLMFCKDPGTESIGFQEVAWLDYARASKKLKTKRDREMLKSGRDMQVVKAKEKAKKKKLASQTATS